MTQSSWGQISKLDEFELLKNCKHGEYYKLVVSEDNKTYNSMGRVCKSVHPEVMLFFVEMCPDTHLRTLRPEKIVSLDLIPKNKVYETILKYKEQYVRISCNAGP